MEKEQRLFEVLRALASSCSKALTVKSLMKRAGYKDYKELNRDLKKLRQLGVIEFRRSGFPSDSFSHAEPIKVHSETEFPIEEISKEDDKIALEINVNVGDNSTILVEIKNPFGCGTSYMTLGDFKKLLEEEQRRIFIKKIDLRFNGV